MQEGDAQNPSGPKPPLNSAGCRPQDPPAPTLSTSLPPSGGLLKTQELLALGNLAAHIDPLAVAFPARSPPLLAPWPPLFCARPAACQNARCLQTTQLPHPPGHGGKSDSPLILPQDAAYLYAEHTGGRLSPVGPLGGGGAGFVGGRSGAQSGRFGAQRAAINSRKQRGKSRVGPGKSLLSGAKQLLAGRI